MADRSPHHSPPRSVRDAITALLRRRNRTIVVECRHCGTSLEPDARSCPNCEYDGIAEYTI